MVHSVKAFASKFFVFLLLWSVVYGPWTSFANAADKPKSVEASAEWQTHFAQGIASGRDGNWDKAIELLEKAASLKLGDNAHNAVHRRMSRAYIEKHRTRFGCLAIF